MYLAWHPAAISLTVIIKSPILRPVEFHTALIKLILVSNSFTFKNLQNF